MKYTVLTAALSLFATGCNQPPRIDKVGDYLIADSIFDYLGEENYSSAPYFNAYAGETLEFQVIAVDPDDDPIEFSAGPLPIDATFDRQTGVFRWTPPEEEEETFNGGLELFIVAQDDRGEWDSVIVFLALGYGGYYDYLPL